MEFNDVLPPVNLKDYYKKDPLMRMIIDTYWKKWKSTNDEKISKADFIDRFQDRIIMSAYSYTNTEIDKLAREKSELERNEQVKKMSK